MKKESFAEIWGSIVKNKDLIEGASVSNSFPVLLILNGAEKPLTTSEVSQRIAEQSKGGVFIIPSTAKSSLEVLQVKGLVKGEDIANEGKGAKKKPVAKTLYSITPFGKKLVNAWVHFLSPED